MWLNHLRPRARLGWPPARSLDCPTPRPTRIAAAQPCSDACRDGWLHPGLAADALVVGVCGQVLTPNRIANGLQHASNSELVRLAYRRDPSAAASATSAPKPPPTSHPLPELAAPWRSDRVPDLPAQRAALAPRTDPGRLDIQFLPSGCSPQNPHKSGSPGWSPQETHGRNGIMRHTSARLLRSAW